MSATNYNPGYCLRCGKPYSVTGNSTEDANSKICICPSHPLPKKNNFKMTKQEQEAWEVVRHLNRGYKWISSGQFDRDISAWQTKPDFNKFNPHIFGFKRWISRNCIEFKLGGFDIRLPEGSLYRIKRDGLERVI